MVRSALLLLALQASLYAQAPQIFYRGVVNAASSMSPGLPSGAVARGSTFSIYGRRLGPATSPALNFPLPTTLGGVSIAVSQGSATLNAIPTFVSPGQINAILPSNTPTGLVSLRVTYNGIRSNPVPVRVVNSSFGIFTANSAGTGPGILQNFNAADNQPINALNNAARRGQVITLWGTGLGPVTTADNVAPTAGTLPTPVEVYVGGVSAPILYSGRTPCCAGIDQIVFSIPDSAPLGCWVPVYVKTDRAVVSNFTTIAIASSSGSSCDEPDNSIAQSLVRGGRSASFVAARFSFRFDAGVPRATDATSDFVGGFLAQQNTAPFNFNPLLSIPPAGTCTAYGMNANLTTEVPILPGVIPTRGLDAGLLTITRGPTQSMRTAPQLGHAFAHLGSLLQLFPSVGGLFYDNSAATVSAAGGADVGSFSAQVSLPQGLTWTNRDQVANVARTQGVTLNWSGAAPGNTVLIAGFNTDVPTNASTVFLCNAPPGAGSFRVPPDILANIAPARRKITQSIGALYVGQWPLASPTAFQASGIDSGSLLGAQVIAKTVVFQ